MNNRLNFENNNNELSFGVPKSKMSMNYNDSYNKPSINGVELIGDLTTEDLGIEIPDESQIFDVSCTISLATMKVSNVTSYSEEIIAKKNEGYLVRLNCTFVENPNLKVVCMLNVIDGNDTFFYPLIRGNIGAGTKNYLFRLGIGKTYATISAHELSEGSDMNIIPEFDTDGNYTEKDVFNAIAILELTELLASTIEELQEEDTNIEKRLEALETVASELEVI